MTASAAPTGRLGLFLSGMALGHYVPGLILEEEARETFARVERYVYEGLLSREKRDTIVRTRDAYQERFRQALLGQRLHGALNSGGAELAAVRASFVTNQARTGVVFSGQWCELLDDTGTTPDLHLVHVDTGSSPSWSAAAAAATKLLRRGAREHWLSRPDGDGRFLILSRKKRPPRWADRPFEMVVHGGGWALGAIDDASRLLADKEWRVRLMNGTRDFIPNLGRNVLQFRTQKDWTPWAVPPTRPYPPLFELGENGRAAPLSDGSRHDVLHFARTARGVISKPGGMSLAESLMTATPLLFLEPYGPHEAANAALWQRHGFGSELSSWVESGCSEAALERMHDKLAAARERARTLLSELGPG